jgi:2-methylcitrate dehydratase PrpD
MALWPAVCLVASVGLVAQAAESTTTATRILARLAIETPAGEISPAAYDAMRRAVIDAVGAALAGHRAPGVVETLAQHREWGGAPEATVWFHGDRLPAPAAAFVNGVQLHAMDFDDYHPPSDTHITAVILPTVLAVGEAERASGKETLAAAILGIEVAGRLGRVFKGARTHEGFLPTSVVGGFGATAAACRLKKLPVDQTVHALGIFHAHASGNRQALFDRTLAKRIQPAIAAQAAVVAACLAGRGITGPERAVEGEAGLLRIYAGAKDWAPDLRDIARRDGPFEVELIRFKKYACCGRSHAAIEAAIQLAVEHDLKPADVEEIEIFGVGVNSGMVGVPWDPAHPIPHVLSQFCAPYEVATAIRNRRMGPAEISPGRIRDDREVSDLALRTRLRDPEDFGGKYPGGQTVRIRTRTGQVLTASQGKSGQVSSDADLVAKFNDNAKASGRCSPQVAGALLEAIRQLDRCEDVGRFVRESLVLREPAIEPAATPNREGRP